MSLSTTQPKSEVMPLFILFSFLSPLAVKLEFFPPSWSCSPWGRGQLQLANLSPVVSPVALASVIAFAALLPWFLQSCTALVCICAVSRAPPCHASVFPKFNSTYLCISPTMIVTHSLSLLQPAPGGFTNTVLKPFIVCHLCMRH